MKQMICKVSTVPDWVSVIWLAVTLESKGLRRAAIVDRDRIAAVSQRVACSDRMDLDQVARGFSLKKKVSRR
jgi:hypothetical protein